MRSAARSPTFSIAGPDVTFMVPPNSVAMRCASVVFLVLQDHIGARVQEIGPVLWLRRAKYEGFL